jgi:hypothetical protein
MANKAIKFEMVVSDEMISRWCAVKGYGSNSPMPMASQAETETEAQFFERIVKAELMNICVLPIQNAIYQQVNQAAQEQIEDLRASAEKAMSVTITELK